jgi:hydrogenase/urease accessory protein HupE
MTVTTTARRGVAAVAVTLATWAAQAHPGHDAVPTSGLLDLLRHLLTEPDHLALLGGAALAVVAVRRAMRRDDRRNDRRNDRRHPGRRP